MYKTLGILALFSVNDLSSLVLVTDKNICFKIGVIDILLDEFPYLLPVYKMLNKNFSNVNVTYF